MFKFKKKKLVFLAVSCVLLLLISLSLPYLKNPAFVILKQPLRLFTFIRQEIIAVIFFHRNAVQRETLKKENEALKSKLNAREGLRLENERLNELLSLRDRSSHKLTASRVIGRSIDSWASSLIIDKGRNSGLRRGMPVLTPLGLIGRIAEANEFTSKVLLINDPNLSVSSIVQRSRQEGLVSGTLGAHLIMRYLPQDADIEINDIIETSGLNETFPKGLLIGVVVDTGKEYSGLSRFAIIKPVVNLHGIEEVLVVVE
ncbi:MAG: rod shape-determining protein MreC [Candidatus Omnitrophota bacterium]